MAVVRRLIIHGRVQGVFYRAWTVETAQELGLVGWVRNRRDGTVEAFVQGEEAAVELFVERAHEGSAYARVERVLAVADDPAHAVHRKLLLPHLAAKKIRELEAFVADTADRLWIDGLRAGRIE